MVEATEAPPYTPPVMVCPSCGTENPAGARFCNACAAPLGPETPAEIRKTVTILFCDLVGSTALGDDADPEVLRGLMARYHAELRRILERHGGTVEKFIGDAAMAVFGVPQAHEDDALRAVRAALEIKQAVEAFQLSARIGINTGEVVAAPGETLVTGDAVNVAARMEQAAESGEILIGEVTERLVRDAARMEPIAPLALKGKTKPVPAFRLLEVRADVPALARRTEGSFVGRERELEALERALTSAIAQRQPGVATIIGPPGIGKSRLTRELIERSDARVLIGRCLSYGQGITYWPLSEIVSQVGDLRSALAESDDGALAASRIAAALGEGSASSDEIAWGFRKLFEALAHGRPTIVVVDDIQWAEPTLLDLLEYVSDFASGAPLLLLCTARPEIMEIRPAWATPRPNATLVTLQPLDLAQAETLVDELSDLSATSKARIVEAAEGNPLFVEQLVAMEAGAGDGRIEIPPTLQALLAARIDRLEPEERAVIERASIEGKLFHRGSVQALLPEPAAGGVGARLLTLVRKGFVRPDRSQLPGDDGFRFDHILIRDAAYDSIPKRLRAELHERFADWMQSRLGEDAPVEILGYHLEQAYRYRVELGQDDEHARGVSLRAGRLLSQGGRSAHARGDDAATRALLERAIGLLPEDDLEVPALLEKLGSATSETGDLQASLEILRRAQVAASVLGRPAIELRARMSELFLLVGSTPRQETATALAEVQHAIAELTRLDDSESLVRAWHALGQVWNLRANFAMVAESEARRLELALRTGLRRDAADATEYLVGALAVGPTPVEDAIRRVEGALAESPDRHFGEAQFGLLEAFAGHHDRARELIERSRRAVLELGQRNNHASMSMFAGWIALLAGEPERVEHDLRAGAEVLEAAGESGRLSTVEATLAEVLYRLDRDEEAEEWTRRSEEITSPEDVLSQAMWRSTRAKVLARRGEADEALRLSAEAIEWVRRTDGLAFLGDTLFARAEVLRLLGHHEDARPVLEEALAVYERKGIVPSIERTRALLSELAVAT